MTELQYLYYEMLRIRRVEEAIAKRYSEQQMRCPVHLSIGQEAAAVGVAYRLNEHDQVVSTHRGHAHFLAKGGSLRGLISELYGKADGCGRGQAGSMHLIDLSCGFEGSTSIVGGTIPIGVGLAFAKKMKGESGIVVVCIGDAAVEEGVFHESANFASLHGLKVLFVLENNQYSCYTHLNERQPHRGFSKIAEAHAMGFYYSDGNDINQVSTRALEAVEAVKAKGPALLQLNTYRHLEHCGPNNDDHLGYRNPYHTNRWLERDPINIGEELLHIANEWTPAFVDSLAKIDEEIRIEFEHAIAAPAPADWELGAYEYKKNCP